MFNLHNTEAPPPEVERGAYPYPDHAAKDGWITVHEAQSLLQAAASDEPNLVPHDEDKGCVEFIDEGGHVNAIIHITEEDHDSGRRYNLEAQVFLYNRKYDTQTATFTFTRRLWLQKQPALSGRRGTFSVRFHKSVFERSVQRAFDWVQDHLNSW